MEKTKGRWTLDTESDNLRYDATVVHCAVLKERATGRVVKFNPDNIHELPQFMDDNVGEVACHNFIGHDNHILKDILGYEFQGKIHDTLVLSRLLSPNRRLPYNCPNPKATPHGLEAWGYRVGRGKPEHDDWSVFTPEMLHRCSEDVEINEETDYALSEETRGLGDWSKAIPMTMKLFQIIEKMTDYGWLVDQEHMHKSISMLRHWIRKIDNNVSPLLPWVMLDEKEVKKPFLKSGQYNKNMEKWFLDTSRDSHEQIDRMFDREVGGPFCRISWRRTNLNSNKEVKEFLLGMGWQPEEWNVNKDTGDKTSPKLTKTDPFFGIVSGIGKLVAKRVQCRHREGVILGWFKLIRPDGRIGQRITGLATTGRAKHSGIVNVPNGEAFFGRWMREVFTVPDDKVLIGVDSDSCQNRMLAGRVGDEGFTNIILHGTKKDKTTIHYVNQRLLEEVGYDVSYGMSKNIGYAFNFGASDNKLGAMVLGHQDDGARVRKALLSVSAGLENLLDSLLDEWQNTAKKRKNKWGSVDYYNGWIEGLDGRAIHVESSHALLVYLLQSDEAIMMSYAFLFLHKWCEDKGWKWGEDWAYVAWNHDEFQCEVSPRIQDEFKALAEKSIAYAGEYLNINIEHIGDADVGRTWADTH